MKKAINRTLPIGLALLLVLLLLPWSMLHVQGAEKPNIGFDVSTSSLQEGDSLTVTVRNETMNLTMFAGGFEFDKDAFEVTMIIPMHSGNDEFQVISSVEDANEVGRVGLAFGKTTLEDATYGAGTLAIVLMTAKKAGKESLTLYEDSEGIDGYQNDSIETKEIEITPSPLSSLQVDPIEIIEGIHGHWQSEGMDPTKTYFHYDLGGTPYPDLNEKVTAIYEGQEYTGSFGEVASQINNKTGKLASFTVRADQSYDNPWTAGNEYNATVAFMGKTTSMKVTILPSPLSTLQVEPIEIIEGTCDYRSLEMNEDSLNTKVTVIYGGQEYTGSFKEVSDQINEITGGKSRFRFIYDRSGAEQWTVGNEYDITVGFMEKTTPAKVRIIPSPVSSIQIENDPIEIIEGTCGREIRIPDATSDLRDLVYFHYDPVRDESVKATVIYDGREYTGSLNQISEQIRNEAKHNDSLLFVSDQSYYNQWTVGNEYDAAISFLGKAVPVKVKIVSENEGLKGDVNGDGNVDAKDLTTLAKHVAKISDIKDAGLLKAADVNGDGEVNAKDLTHLAKYVAKIIPDL